MNSTSYRFDGRHKPKWKEESSGGGTRERAVEPNSLRTNLVFDWLDSFRVWVSLKDKGRHERYDLNKNNNNVRINNIQFIRLKRNLKIGDLKNFRKTFEIFEKNFIFLFLENVRLSKLKKNSDWNFLKIWKF